jgi:hypothetical protein
MAEPMNYKLPSPLVETGRAEMINGYQLIVGRDALVVVAVHRSWGTDFYRMTAKEALALATALTQAVTEMHPADEGRRVMSTQRTDMMRDEVVAWLKEQQRNLARKHGGKAFLTEEESFLEDLLHRLDPILADPHPSSWCGRDCACWQAGKEQGRGR